MEMTSPSAETQHTRKAQNSRALRRATVWIALAALGLTGVLTYAAATGTTHAKPAATVSTTGAPAEVPTINFPAGPMSAIEAACESAKKAAEAKRPAYIQAVERQCEAAKQVYERAHP